MVSTAEIATSDSCSLLGAYLTERLDPHPLFRPHLPHAARLVVGPVAFGAWDERSPLQLALVLSDARRETLAAALQAHQLWDPAADYRVMLPDREPFRRFPGAEIRVLSASELAQEFQFDLPVALWFWEHAAVRSDPDGVVADQLREARGTFARRLNRIRCEHYYHFRRARQDLLAPRLSPSRARTLLAIRLGETAREAMRLAFLADGIPYPGDHWLEWAAERETRSGESLLAAVHALLAADEASDLEHAGKVLRARVVHALQQGGVSEPWLEQWWMWPALGPAD